MTRRQHGRGTLRRYVLGSVLVVLCTTAAVSVAAIVGVVGTIAADFAGAGRPLDTKDLTPAAAGAAQTILVIGDDHIGPTTTYSTGAEQTVNGYHYLHADTFMLVRMDPVQGQTSILSIPRDLLVSFTWHGQRYSGKFNSTYSIGGDDLVKQVVLRTFPGLKINHIIDFNFASFIGLVDAIGCVYVDVDHRYLNNTDPSYQFINIEPGYQRLCGADALSYVRYRHTDSDFVRVARQQDFIRQTKEQLGVWGFVSRWNQLASAFAKAVWTDIRGDTEVADLLQLAIFSQQKPIRQVPFRVANPDYPIAGVGDTVLSTAKLIRESLDDFLYIHPPAPAIEVAAVPSGHTKTAFHHHSHAATPTTSRYTAPSNDLYPLSSGIRNQALALSPRVPFPVELPTVQTGPASPNDFYAYRIGDEQHHLHFGYRIDWSAGSEGEYYGIEGMNWTNPPLFANANATRSIDGRLYMFVNDGAHIHDIGWRQRGVLYWVSNTLNETLTDPQMLAIARSARPVAP
jgi:LCP family protein required for cell wall assembly